MNNLEFQSYFRRNLPHLQLPGAIYFITSRLAGSLPKNMSLKLSTGSKHQIKQLQTIDNQTNRIKKPGKFYLEQFNEWDSYLDVSKTGPLYLRRKDIARLVADSLHYRDGNVFDLFAYCIMPNHFHLVIEPLQVSDEQYYSLSKIMHSLKRYTARLANQILGHEGAFWQHENYDRVIRNETELENTINYVIQNPVKAGFVQEWEN